MSWWPAVVLGWPAVVLAVLLMGTAIIKGRWLLGAAAVIPAAPFCAYVAASPGSRWLGVGMLLLLISVPIALFHRRKEIAASLLAGLLLALAWLANMVFPQA